MKHLYPLLIAILFIAAIAGAVLLTRSCKPEPFGNPEQLPTETTRKKTISTHQLRAQIEAEFRQRETTRLKAYSDSLSRSKVIVQEKKDKAVASVKRYQESKSIARCDTAITALQDQVSILETTVSISDSVIASGNRLNASLNGTVQRQEQVISDLNTGWQKANEENQALQKKLKRRNRLLKIGAGIVGVFVAGMIVSK